MLSLLRRIFLIDILKGLWVTLKYTPQPAFTFQYPAERRPVAPRFRGVLRLQVEPESGAQVCIVCDQCAKACPDDLIALGGHREAGQKIKILDYFDFNLSRCSFCGLCAEVCPTKPIKALVMSEDYELGSYSRDTQVLRVDDMYDGVPRMVPAWVSSEVSIRATPKSATLTLPSASRMTLAGFMSRWTTPFLCAWLSPSSISPMMRSISFIANRWLASK